MEGDGLTRDKTFTTPTEDAILRGEVTDKYFERTEDALRESGENPHVVAEVTADQFGNGDHEVLAGLADVAGLLKGLPIDVEAKPEGAVFDGGPVMNIEGDYLDFARYETALLGFLSHASGVATAAREVASAAGDTPVYSFGTRHVHPMLAVMVERSAMIGGMDGYSNTVAEETLPGEASGTMPHALMLAHGRGGEREAWTAFNDSTPADVPRIVLTDTFTDETDEAVQAALTLGGDLDAVRLDTTGSRRGDFAHIIKEVRWKLEDHDRGDVDIFVSGGLGPADLRELRDIVDGFGVGGYVASADPVDFSLDIVVRDGIDIAKRGKLSGKKDTHMEPVIVGGDVVRDFDVAQAAERAHKSAQNVDFRGEGA